MWHRSPSAPRLLGLLGVLALAAGCSTNSIIVNVDIASFFSPDLLSTHYGGPQAVPPQTQVSVPILAQTVATPEGLDQLTEVEEADLHVRAVFTHQSGQASATMEVMFAPEGEDPFAQTPAVSLPVLLSAGETTVVENTVALAASVRDLFLSGKFEVGLRITLQTEGVDPVYGSYRIEAMDAHVVTNPNLGG